MNTPTEGKRRHNNPELASKYAQKKGKTKAQKRLERRQHAYDSAGLATAKDGYRYIKPGSMK